MSRLAELQQRFQAYVLSGDRAMLPSVIELGGASAERRLDVYHDGYRLRLIEVLGNDFPGLRHLLGERFKTVAEAYVEASPSPHFNVRWYADRFADFLRTHADTAATPGLAEMAALEWTLTLAFDAPDQTLTVLEDAGAVAPQAWGTMRFEFAASLHLLPLHWNVAAIRLAVDQAGDGAQPDLALLESAQTQAVWRQDFRVRHRPLAVDELAALTAARAGASFGDLCMLLCEWHAEEAVALRAAELLKNWIHEQWITGLLIDASEPA